MSIEEVLARFPGAVAFMEFDEPSAPMGAVGVVVDAAGNALAFDTDPPRPISFEELGAKGAFACKPEDFGELIGVP